MKSQPAYEGKNWTYQEYLHLDDESRYELLEGALTMAPAPDLRHQDIVRDLGFLLWGYVRQKRLGKVYSAPVDVVLDSHTVVQPDLLFVSSARGEILQPRGIMGSPDLVVEIISPSSLYLDRNRKKDLYEHFGVREYWIVDPARRSIDVLVLEDGGYRLWSAAIGEGGVGSRVLEGFFVEIAEVLP